MLCGDIPIFKADGFRRLATNERSFIIQIWQVVLITFELQCVQIQQVDAAAVGISCILFELNALGPPLAPKVPEPPLPIIYCLISYSLVGWECHDVRY